jgi:hypothetical protein
VAPAHARVASTLHYPFAKLADDQLLSAGVPADWLADVRTASEDAFLELPPHLPAEASESLLQFATSGILAAGGAAPDVMFSLPEPRFDIQESHSLPLARPDPYNHPNALRRFRAIESVEELAQALDSPWEKWMVYLHPSQRETVEKDFAARRASPVPPGPARP